MQIWVDADACPVAIREIICRAASRTGIVACFVSNHPLPLPKSPFILKRQVPSGFDVADNEIVKNAEPGDLVVTGDIPLAAEVIEQGATALNTRGELLTADNIRAKLNMRDFMDTLRSSGIETGGSAALSQSDRQAFANHLDTYLTRALKNQ
ncbi:MAG: YaiI/YqxD family protein [Ketobacteraceae bacterium]|nr:YaiI/YqxD family protein [Ketobacteraceae bacterium]